MHFKMLASQGLAELFNNMVSVNSCISFNFCDYLEFRTRGENSISESVHVGALLNKLEFHSKYFTALYI